MAVRVESANSGPGFVPEKERDTAAAEEPLVVPMVDGPPYAVEPFARTEFVYEPKQTILEEAARITSADRQKIYGHPRINFDRIATYWSLYLGVPITPRQTAMMMILLKVARDQNVPHRDALVDIAGYARTAEMVDEP